MSAYCASLLNFVTLVLTGDIDSLRKDLEDPARPMKASAFASEEPAPFTPVSLKGLLFRIVVIFLKATYTQLSL